jgi:hypothetical protein
MSVSRQTIAPLPAPTSFATHIKTPPLWDRRLLQNVDLKDATALLAHLLTAEPLFVVSDGGALDERGSFGA